MPDLQFIVSRIDTLPTLPEVHTKLAELAQKDTSTASDLAEVITKDPALGTRLLKLVNSAMYSLPRKVDSITQAIVIVGFRALQNLALSTSIIGAFRGRKIEEFDFTKYWKHSLACAVAARSIATALRKRQQADEVFAAGLLHDLGHLILAEYQPKKFQEVLKACASTKSPAHSLEPDILGFTHEEVGALLMEHWKFPEALVAIVRRHHSPDRTGNHAMECRWVQLADLMAKESGFTIHLDQHPVAIDAAAVEQVGLREEDLADIREALPKGVEELTQTLGI